LRPSCGPPNPTDVAACAGWSHRLLVHPRPVLRRAPIAGSQVQHLSRAAGQGPAASLIPSAITVAKLSARSKINPRQPPLLETHLRRQIPQRLGWGRPESAYSTLQIRAEQGDDLLSVAHQGYGGGWADIDFRATRSQRRFSRLELDHHRFPLHPTRISRANIRAADGATGGPRSEPKSPNNKLSGRHNRAKL